MAVAGALAVTGASTGRYLLVAVAAIVIGVALLLAAKRRGRTVANGG